MTRWPITYFCFIVILDLASCSSNRMSKFSKTSDVNNSWAEEINVSCHESYELTRNSCCHPKVNKSNSFEESVNMSSGASVNISSGESFNISSEARVNISYGAKVNIRSGASVNISSGASVNISSGASVNISSGASVNISSGASVNISSGASVNISSGASVNISSGASVNISSEASLNISSGASVNISSGASVNISSGTRVNISSGFPLLDTLKNALRISYILNNTFTDRVDNVTKIKNKIEIYNDTMKTNKNKTYNATLYTDNDVAYDDTANPENNGTNYVASYFNKNGRIFNGSLKGFKNLKRNLTKTSHSAFLDVMVHDLRSIPTNQDKFLTSKRVRSEAPQIPPLFPKKVNNKLPSDDRPIMVDSGHLMDGDGGGSIALTPATSDLQCFGCNGEVMLGDANTTTPPTNIQCQVCLKTTFSFTPNVFKLVQATDSFLNTWTNSQCESRGACKTCNHSNWYVQRPDGICKRLYIYSIAMPYDVAFEDHNTIPHFMVYFLKEVFSFDILFEWWPTKLTYDRRVDTGLYMATLLVYDVHRASINDAMQQLRHISLLSYALRHSCRDMLTEPISLSEQRWPSMFVRESFDLGAQMAGVYDHFSLRQVSNRSVCLCKAVLGPFFGYLLDFYRVCRLGCFIESLSEVERDLDLVMNMPCTYLENSVRGFSRWPVLIYLLTFRIYFHLKHLFYI